MVRKPGDVVRPSVRLLKLLATGGMGSLWTAWHETLGVEVGVKFIDDRFADEPEALERFRREAAMAARIKSPHVVQVFDQGIMDDGTPYIIMELLEGEPLSERIARGWLSFEDAARVVVQVARGLSAAHERGIVHRDIKPENIFLCDDEESFNCKVLDFGVGRHAVPGERKLTAPGVLLGTPEFMSPEVILGRRQPDAHVDLWALAVVIYYALATELPFDAATAREIVLKVVSKPHLPLSVLRPDVSPDIDAWFSRALSKKIDERFSSARELASAFVAAIDARRPSLRFSQPDPAEAGTLPGFGDPESIPVRSSRRGVDSGTIRISESSPTAMVTPTGTAIMPRDATPQRTTMPVVSEIPPPPPSTPPDVVIPRAPRTMREEKKTSALPLIALLAGVSVLSTLVTLTIMRVAEPSRTSAVQESFPSAPELPAPVAPPPPAAPSTASAAPTPSAAPVLPMKSKHGF